MTISVLPDNVLLEIFDLCDHNYTYHNVWEWHLLVHVCQRWRQIVYSSPHRLNLKILCTPRTPVRKNLDIWPPFPIVIDYWRGVTPKCVDDVITALEHFDRVCDVSLSVTGSKLEKIITVMQEPFPVLKSLHIVSSNSQDGSVPVLPANFLGGSAPCLQEMYLFGIPFPALPTLLSSTDLVALELCKIPPIGYFSPEALVVGLAASPRLETFLLGFQFNTSHPRRIPPPPVTRTVLPALTYFHFRGGSEYLEDLVARIDGPQLRDIHINYFNQLVDFQVAPLAKFIDRRIGPKSKLRRTARVTFSSGQVSFDEFHRQSYPSEPNLRHMTTILCEGIDWQVSHMAQVLSQFSATLSNVVHLELNTYRYCPPEDTDVEWVHLLHQFSALQALNVSRDIAGHVALALEGIAMVAEVLPSLGLIYLNGQPASTVEKFVAARRLSDRPVTVVDTRGEFDERIKSYVSE